MLVARVRQAQTGPIKTEDVDGSFLAFPECPGPSPEVVVIHEGRRQPRIPGRRLLAFFDEHIRKDPTQP